MSSDNESLSSYKKILGNLGRVVKQCRMCKGTHLTPFLDLGFHPHSDHFLSEEELHESEVYYPLKVNLCNDCGLIQLGYVVHGEYLYDKNYVYESSVTKMGRDHYGELAETIARRFGVPESPLAIDIGSNVGVLLSAFKTNGFRVLGVDPTPHIAAIANKSGIETLKAFFGTKIASEILRTHGKAHVITATNVFMHIDNLEDAMEAVHSLIDQDGVFIVEAPYVLDLLKKNEYDTIYHQHLGYISVRPLIPFFRRFGIEVFDVALVKIHGGSLRIFTGNEGAHPVSPSVSRFLENEEKERIYTKERLADFRMAVEDQRRDLISLLRDIKAKNKRIAGISAPAKGNTLLNYCKIDSSILDYLTEKSIYKIGKFSPGMHIPIYADSKILEDMPDYALILAWNFAEEIMKNMEEYRKRGGKFIIPIPKPVIA
jgi:SAM-dependent methyltransferase